MRDSYDRTLTELLRFFPLIEIPESILNVQWMRTLLKDPHYGTMDANLIEGSTLQWPSAEEIRSLSRRMGFVIKDEEISVYLGK